MTFWQFLTNLCHALTSHGTRVLGVAVGTITALTTSNVIPANHLKYYLAAIAVLTYWRGQGNADKIADKVIEKTQGPLAARPPEIPK
ncbi:MAG TPA: hypothetical protein VFB37_00930 [Steroidobacteraceae bacterium]|nr:hypothetical protein [Steroidobacteraceae bacterium]